jgi:hypothetical protein
LTVQVKGASAPGSEKVANAVTEDPSAEGSADTVGLLTTGAKFATTSENDALPVSPFPSVAVIVTV